MPTDTRVLPKACREHIDGINKALVAGDDARALYLAFQYFRARVKHIQGGRRAQDADGFRRYAARTLAGLAAQVHDHKPGGEDAPPLIPGGDWRP